MNLKIREMDKPKILIVDDEPFYTDLLVDLLNPQYHTVVAENGEQAIEYAGTEPKPDLILLDILMPGIDGYDVCRRLKGMGKFFILAHYERY